MWNMDMSHFYMHLLIAEENRLYLLVLFDGIKCECTAKPFGLGPAPRIAIKFVLLAIQYLP